MSVVVTLWRVAPETRDCLADDLSGSGAAKNPGRWNEKGQQVVYTGVNPALAVLETVAHIDIHGLPLNRFLVEIHVPIAVWERRKRITIDVLPAGWDAMPGGLTSIRIGAAWYRSGKTALLEVPSAIVEEDRVVLINAEHPDAREIKATVGRKFNYNHVLRGPMNV